MLCPNCGQECPDHETICPGCGHALPDAEPAMTDADSLLDEILAEMKTSDSTPDGETEAPDTADDAFETIGLDDFDDFSDFGDSPEADDPDSFDAEAPESEATPQPAKKRSKLPVILTAIIGLLLIAVVCLTITLTTLSKTGSMPGFITAISDYFERRSLDPDAVAVNITDESGENISEITNAQLSFYYWGEYFYYVQTNGFSFDASKPLDEQSYSDTQTWQDYFLENAQASLVQIEAIKAEAEAAGFTMPEQYQTEYDNTVSSMTTYAQQTGFTDQDGNGDALAYVRDSYGPAATLESFSQYLYDSYYVTAYSDEIYNGLDATDEEIEAYYDENADKYAAYGIEKSELPNINVRHILIQPEADDEGNISDEAWDEAETEAKRILKEWKSGDATEESFGELANTYSTDPGSSSNGGLYEDVYPGQMVTEFNDWCFDKKRKSGDTDIVKTTYGYHIMYYVDATEDYYWKSTAKSELLYQKYEEAVAAITGRYTAAATDKLKLAIPDAVKSIQEEAAADAAAQTPAPTTAPESSTADSAADSAVDGAAG